MLRFLQVPVPLPLVSGLSSVRINIPSDLQPPEARQNILSAVQELGKRYPQGLPKLHPIAVKILPT
jgi:ATP-dependent RNA helicase DOB1